MRTRAAAARKQTCLGLKIGEHVRPAASAGRGDHPSLARPTITLISCRCDCRTNEPGKPSKPGGPSSRLRHYLSQLCRCCRRAYRRRACRQGRPSKPGPSCRLATNPSHSYPVGAAVQLRLPARRVSHPSLATRAADFDTGHPAQLCPSCRQCQPGRPSKPAPTDHRAHILSV